MSCSWLVHNYFLGLVEWLIVATNKLKKVVTVISSAASGLNQVFEYTIRCETK